MKKIKIETVAKKSLEQVNAGFRARIREGRYAVLGIKPYNNSGAMPSTMELATLAATLARTSAESQEKLCVTALNLWFTSQETITLQQQCSEDYRQLKAAEKPLPEPPIDQEWPMTLETFCKILWPGKNTGERAEIIRAWLKSLPTNHPYPQMNGVSYGQMRGEPIDKARFYFLRDSILPWYEKWKLTANSAEKSKNAKKSWQDCDAKIQKTPEYQEFKAECENRGKKTSQRGFKKWLVSRNESPDEKAARLVKKILPAT